MLEEWTKKDPIARYEGLLVSRGVASPDELVAARNRIETALAEDLAFAEASPFPDARSGLSDVYAERPVEPPVPPIVSEHERRKAPGKGSDEGAP